MIKYRDKQTEGTMEATKLTNDCGICMTETIDRLTPAPPAAATYMPCCSFNVHLECIKEVFQKIGKICPQCKKENPLASSENKARFITYLLLSPNNLDVEGVENIFATTLYFPSPRDGEPLDIRKHSISFFDTNVLHNVELTERLAALFDRLFSDIERTTPDDVESEFVSLEVAGLEDRVAIRDSSRRCEKIVIYALGMTAIALSIAIVVIVMKNKN